METYVVISECAVHDTGDDVLSGVLLHFGKALRVIDMSVNFGFWLQRFVGIVDNLLILFLDIQYLCISKDSGVGILAAAFREKYGLENKIILLGVASVWDERKGLRDFLALHDLLDERYAIVLIGLSAKQIQSLPAGILGLPRTNSVQELAQAYTAADVFLNPSTEETFGMTVLEARCCGTEAVVYQGTACEEVVSQFGGVAVPRGAAHLLEAVEQITKENRK